MTDQELNSEKDGLNENGSGPETPKVKFNCKYQYKPEYCAELISHGAEGGNIQQFADKLGVPRRVIAFWVRKYPEFKNARELSSLEKLFY